MPHGEAPPLKTAETFPRIRITGVDQTVRGTRENVAGYVIIPTNFTSLGFWSRIGELRVSRHFTAGKGVYRNELLMSQSARVVAHAPLSKSPPWVCDAPRPTAKVSGGERAAFRLERVLVEVVCFFFPFSFFEVSCGEIVAGSLPFPGRAFEFFFPVIFFSVSTPLAARGALLLFATRWGPRTTDYGSS